MTLDLQLRVQRYGWDRAAGYYENAWQEQLRPAQDCLLSLLNLLPGQRVLEVACGTGMVTMEAARRVGRGGLSVGTDISQKMVDLAADKARGNGLLQNSFYRMEACRQEFPSASFDAVMNAFGLMYVPDPLEAVREQFRLLRTGGRAGAAVWGRCEACGWNTIFPIVDARVNTDVCPLFFQLGTAGILEKTFEKAGFRNIQKAVLNVNLYYYSREHALQAAFSGGPVAMAYSRFDEATRREVHAEYLESIEPYRYRNEYTIPGEFVVVVGEK
jgi:SAM-dependent methyltransferase